MITLDYRSVTREGKRLEPPVNSTALLELPNDLALKTGVCGELFWSIPSEMFEPPAAPHLQKFYSYAIA